jgi:hypothetical protein
MYKGIILYTAGKTMARDCIYILGEISRARGFLKNPIIV